MNAEIVAQLPASGEKRTVRDPLNRHGRKVGKRELGAAGGHRLEADLSSQHRGDLEVEQFRGCQGFAAQPVPGAVSIGSVVAHGRGDHGGINDDHARRTAP